MKMLRNTKRPLLTFLYVAIASAAAMLTGSAASSSATVLSVFPIHPDCISSGCLGSNSTCSSGTGYCKTCRDFSCDT